MNGLVSVDNAMKQERRPIALMELGGQVLQPLVATLLHTINSGLKTASEMGRITLAIDIK
jgi:hypothetical protein